MKTFDAVLFFNDGFEEAEAITPLDVLRRGGCEAVTVSLTGKKEVTGAHGVTVLADALYDEIFPDKPETQGIMMVLPGGPGTSGYKKHAAFLETLRRHHGAGGNFAAICAAPSILGTLGFLNGVNATCFPGYEQELVGANLIASGVAEDGRFVTGKSAGYALEFGLAVLKKIKGSEVSERIRKDMMGES